MEIVNIKPKEYDQIFKDVPCFNKAAFNILNSGKCDEVFYMIFKDRKVRLGFIAGRQGKMLSSPFSAPFGGLSTLDSKINIPFIEEALDLIEDFCHIRNISKISITLPPLFYDEAFLTKVTHALYQKNWHLDQLDLNFFFNLDLMGSEDNTSFMSYSARKNLKSALKNPLIFSHGKNDEDIRAAYEIIRINRETKGYPLRMTEQQIIDTSKILPVDSFFVYYNDEPVASALVYQVTKKIPQVVYWGDLADFSGYRPMNFLTYNLFNYFHGIGFKTLDVGTAMLDNMPNYGLCEFKESVGCKILPRCSFTKEIL
jgi:hypothetical protein